MMRYILMELAAAAFAVMLMFAIGLFFVWAVTTVVSDDAETLTLSTKQWQCVEKKQSAPVYIHTGNVIVPISHSECVSYRRLP